MRRKCAGSLGSNVGGPSGNVRTWDRENTLQDVITKLDLDLFRTVTDLTVEDFHLLVRLMVFNTEHMNRIVFAFRRYEDVSLRYTGVDSHPGLTNSGLYGTVVAREQPTATAVFLSCRSY